MGRSYHLRSNLALLKASSEVNPYRHYHAYFTVKGNSTIFTFNISYNYFIVMKSYNSTKKSLEYSILMFLRGFLKYFLMFHQISIQQLHDKPIGFIISSPPTIFKFNCLKTVIIVLLLIFNFNISYFKQYCHFLKNSITFIYIITVTCYNSFDGYIFIIQTRFKYLTVGSFSQLFTKKNFFCFLLSTYFSSKI